MVRPASPPAATGRKVWLFGGQIGRDAGSRKELYARFPAFAAAFDEVCAALEARLRHPVKEVALSGADGAEPAADERAMSFASQVALARLLESLGVRPDVVAGHATGEVAAAYVAGVFDLADAARLVAGEPGCAGELTLRRPRIPMVCARTGEPDDERVATPDYWDGQLHRPRAARDPRQRRG